MQFENFKNFVKAGLEKVYGEGNVELTEVTKNNGVKLPAVTVKTGKSFSPIVYLNWYFSEYKNFPEDAVKAMVEAINESLDRDIVKTVNGINDFDTVKDCIVFEVVNGKNEIAVKTPIPETDLCKVYRIQFELDDNTKGSTIITPPMLKTWKKSVEEIDAIATENTLQKYPAVVGGVWSMIKSTGLYPEMDIPDISDFYDEPMLVITNSERKAGASVMAYPGLETFKEISEVWEEDLYILPCSIHEVIVVKQSKGTPNWLLQMVTSVNREELSPEDKLSDSVYEYTRKEKKIKKIA